MSCGGHRAETCRECGDGPSFCHGPYTQYLSHHTLGTSISTPTPCTGTPSTEIRRQAQVGVYPRWVPKLFVNSTRIHSCGIYKEFGHLLWVYTHLGLAQYLCTGGPVHGVGVEIEVPTEVRSIAVLASGEVYHWHSRCHHFRTFTKANNATNGHESVHNKITWTGTPSILNSSLLGHVR